MPWNKTHTKASPGKPISASAYNELADTCDKLSRISVQAPLELLRGPAGPLIRLVQNLGFELGVVDSSGITAMDISTLTPGTGIVNLYTWNGTNLALLGSPPVGLTVFSIASTSGGIPSGTTVIVGKIGGDYWVFANDCG